MSNVNDYLELVTSQHAGKPKFRALLQLLAQSQVDLINFYQSLPSTEFDVDLARWTGLDFIGVRIGLDRSLRATAPGIYTQAPPAGVVPLADNDYKILIRGKIGANQFLGSIESAYQKLTNIFGNTGSYLFIQDYQDMSIAIAVSGNVPSAAFMAALSGGYMQVRPAGVLAKYYYPTAPGGPLFGFDVQNQFIAGFDTGVWAQN